MGAFIKEANKRHTEIAIIANHLGAKVSPKDVKIVCEAIRVEYETRHNKDTFYRDIAILCKEVSYA